MYAMRIEDHVLRELHRAAVDAGRRGVSVPSSDLDAVTRRVGSREVAQKAIGRLVRGGHIVRVRKDLLVLPEATGLLGVDMTDLVHAIAPQPYLITGGRALEHHQLTDQHFFGIVVLVPAHMKKLSYRGQITSFFRTDSRHIWGWEDGARPQVATPERAIVDTLNHPRYGVSLAMGLESLLLASSKDPAFLDRLHAAVVRYDSRAAARRIGLVVERFFGADAAGPYRDLLGANRAPVLLRSSGPATGPVNTSWRVVVNAVLEPERAPA